MNVLSLRGGGIKGIASAILMDRLERRLGAKINEMFDLIVGTSTGAILGAALAAGIEASAIVRMYDQHGKSIFRRRLSSWMGLTAAKYDETSFALALHDTFGDMRMGDLGTPFVAPCVDADTFQSVFIKSRKHGEVRVCDAARASASAPTYFAPAELVVDGVERRLMDGGLFANNPAAFAMVEARKLVGSRSTVTLVDVSCPTVHSTPGFTGRGVLSFAKVGLDAFMDSGMDATEELVRMELGSEYLRIVPSLDSASPAMDDVSPRNVGALKRAAWRQAEDFVDQIHDHII